jgi:hypothetical protein
MNGPPRHVTRSTHEYAYTSLGRFLATCPWLTPTYAQPCQDSEGRTSLMLAIQYEKEAAAEALIAATASAGALDVQVGGLGQVESRCMWVVQEGCRGAMLMRRSRLWC